MMNASVKGTEKQEKDDVVDAKVVVETREPANNELALTVRARDQEWTFHCRDNQPLANTLFVPLENIVGGKCMLHYDSTKGNQILDRTKTPSFYGMIYDDIIFLGGIIRVVE